MRSTHSGKIAISSNKRHCVAILDAIMTGFQLWYAGYVVKDDLLKIPLIPAMSR
jgi:hypothetical protein